MKFSNLNIGTPLDLALGASMTSVALLAAITVRGVVVADESTLA